MTSAQLFCLTIKKWPESTKHPPQKASSLKMVVADSGRTTLRSHTRWQHNLTIISQLLSPPTLPHKKYETLLSYNSMNLEYVHLYPSSVASLSPTDPSFFLRFKFPLPNHMDKIFSHPGLHPQASTSTHQTQSYITTIPQITLQKFTHGSSGGTVGQRVVLISNTS